MDVNPPKIYYLLLDGILIFEDNRDNVLEAHIAHVRHGIVKIGEENTPFTHQANIILHGEKEDDYMAFNS